MLIRIKCRWLLPFVGHTGIAYSSGIIRDFAGPYTVTVGDTIERND